LSVRWKPDHTGDFLKSLEEKPSEREIKRRKQEQEFSIFCIFVGVLIGVFIGVLLTLSLKTDAETAEANAQAFAWGSIFIFSFVTCMIGVHYTSSNWRRRQKEKKGKNVDEKSP